MIFASLRFGPGVDRFLDELEQSWNAARHFSQSIQSGYIDDMSIQEQGEYQRYVYFTKRLHPRILDP